MATRGPGWGNIDFGRFTLIEAGGLSEQNDGTVTVEGQESSPPGSVAECQNLHEQVLGLQTGRIYATQFTDKANRNGYYQITGTTANMMDYQGEVVSTNWSVSMSRMGSDAELDIQSRITGLTRSNDFGLSGERWHAPAGGHYSYYTGTASPSMLTRTGADGAMTIYRSIPNGISPRWGCAVENFKKGRVRITDSRLVGTDNEIEGINRELGPGSWSLSNGLVNVSPSVSAGVLDVQAYSGAAYHSKAWRVTVAGAAPVWESASILRNDHEMCVVRLVASRSPGRSTLDLSLRRGSRALEAYVQTGSSATLGVALVSAETNVNTAASGYLTATSNDADGNRFVCGSAKTFTGSTNGAMTKSAATAMDFFLAGVIAGGSAVSGDAATDIRNQYIAAVAESTYVVRR